MAIFCCLRPYTTHIFKGWNLCANANVYEEARIGYTKFWCQSLNVVNHQSPLTMSHKMAT